MSLHRALFTFAVLALAISLGACKATEPPADGGSKSPGADSGALMADGPGTDGAPEHDAPAPPDGLPTDAADDGAVGACPAAVPGQGGACQELPDQPYLLSCEYGGDSRGLCTTTAECILGRWVVSPPAPGCGVNAASCPASYGDRATCPTQDTCDYEQGRCDCETCVDAQGPSRGPQALWHCRPWVGGGSAGCPDRRPLLGTPCVDEGKFCNWGRCCAGPALGPEMVCHAGAWRGYVDTGCACVMQSCASLASPPATP
ncbi:MAG: hypothetical protein ACJ780_25070 [Solirubrobacteraceae bacterium]